MAQAQSKDYKAKERVDTKKLVLAHFFPHFLFEIFAKRVPDLFSVLISHSFSLNVALKVVEPRVKENTPKGEKAFFDERRHTFIHLQLRKARERQERGFGLQAATGQQKGGRKTATANYAHLPNAHTRTHTRTITYTDTHTRALTFSCVSWSIAAGIIKLYCYKTECVCNCFN